MKSTLEIRSTGPGLHDITEPVRRVLEDASPADGLLTLFVQHTSCSLVVQENADPDVRRDLDGFFRRLVPHGDDPSMNWLRHTTEGPDDMPAHIKAALLPVSLSVPVANGRMMLGTWQGIYLFEHRDEPQIRRVVVHFRAD